MLKYIYYKWQCRSQFRWPFCSKSRLRNNHLPDQCWLHAEDLPFKLSVFQEIPGIGSRLLRLANKVEASGISWNSYPKEQTKIPIFSGLKGDSRLRSDATRAHQQVWNYSPGYKWWPPTHASCGRHFSGDSAAPAGAAPAKEFDQPSPARKQPARPRNVSRNLKEDRGVNPLGSFNLVWLFMVIPFVDWLGWNGFVQKSGTPFHLMLWKFPFEDCKSCNEHCHCSCQEDHNPIILKWIL